MPLKEFGLRIALAAGAVLTVTGTLAIGLWFFASQPLAAPHPFGSGLHESTFGASGVGGMILAWQAQFYQALRAALSALRESNAAFGSLIGLGFGYGIFHAAGPGHGKAVIAAYLVANDRTLKTGFLLSLAAALVQAAIAVALVGVAALVFAVTASQMNRAAATVEILGFAALLLLGGWMCWRKSGSVAKLVLRPEPHANYDHAHHTHECGCGHAHHAPPLDPVQGWRSMAAIVLTAGMRPCSGALILLVFALSQNLFAAGIAAVFAMALGTALTTGAIAATAVHFKRWALRRVDAESNAAAWLSGTIELLAAALVLVLGLALLLGWLSSS